jgi:hypothetical protein
VLDNRAAVPNAGQGESRRLTALSREPKVSGVLNPTARDQDFGTETFGTETFGTETFGTKTFGTKTFGTN